MQMVVFENDAIKVTRVSIEPFGAYVPLTEQAPYLAVFLNRQAELRSCYHEEHQHYRDAGEAAWYEGAGAEGYQVRNIGDDFAERLLIEVKTAK